MMFDTFIEQLTQISLIDWFAMVTGIVGVWLSIQEKVAAWPLFILCYGAYIYISFRSGFYAFGGMNIAFVGIATYGWYQWAKPKSQDTGNGSSICHLPTKNWGFIATFIACGSILIGWLLSNTGEARFPYIDAFATCCAFTAQWMLSKKYIENWLFWILADVVYTCFFYIDRIWPSVILFTVFIFLAIKGWREWKAISSNKASN
ncbi:MAG TPA: hypothetical protein DCX06_11875 [Opitutae bacterium]|nr:hypothetical protein [Opitutae bacterium]